MTGEFCSVFAALAHDTRLRCMLLLMKHGELCVCELTHALAASQPHISRHLAQLRDSGLVTDRRDGVWVYYRVNPDLPPWLTGVLRETTEALGDLEPFVDDGITLAAMVNRPRAARCA